MRSSGILLHISSLPNKYGIGSLGEEAYEFVRFLKETGQKYWQVLPIGPTSYGDSPYQTFSAFAGNPYFIDLDMLIKDGLINKDEIFENINNTELVNYERLYKTRFLILNKAYKRFEQLNTCCHEFENFKNENDYWLHDYALFMTLKSKLPEGNWKSWPVEYQNRHSSTCLEIEKNSNIQLEYWKFIQFLFFTQWNNLKKYANSLGIEIIGDMPIYVAYDSSDVWANPLLWQLDSHYNPTVVAGVPPDYFSKTGQLWGNPIYNYKLMKEDNYSWWLKRIRESFKLFDVVRIDHFRGFESYYAIPYLDKTAINGRWIKGPGMDLFNIIKKELGDLNIIAEDLGFLTSEVQELLKASGFPGMKVLQFAFDDGEDKDNDYLPHNHLYNSICYTGTHDNKTLKEWLDDLTPDVKKFCFEYCNITSEEDAIDQIICTALASVSRITIIPLQDYLHLGKEARFNTPSTLGSNWQWRLNVKSLTQELKNKILRYTKLYKR